MPIRLIGTALWFLSLAGALLAGIERVVIIKVDGLPGGLLEQLLTAPPRPGQPAAIPWIERVFGVNGTRLENFYSRSISLSAPAWSILESGQHLRIRGNVEFDRYTLETYDYLNFFPFYVNYALSNRVDMPAVEVLDDCGIPMLFDGFPYTHRYQSFELLQRGVRWRTLQHGAQGRFTSRSVRELFNEWETGFTFSSSVQEQLERELVSQIKNSDYKLLDYFTGEFDHTAHATSDVIAQRVALADVDQAVGRIWTAIQDSALRDRTVLILVSDHGINSVEGIHSQGWNLVRFFASPAGGNHHVVTDRYPLSEFKIKGLDPFVSQVVTPAKASPYIGKDAESFPTALLDVDGNERASVSLRNSDWNALYLVFQELDLRRPKEALRAALIQHAAALMDRMRPQWNALLEKFSAELTAVEGLKTKLQSEAANQPKKWTDEQRQAGVDKDARRLVRRLTALRAQTTGYLEYLKKLRTLAGMDAKALEANTGHLTDLVPRRSLGEPNSVYQIQNYVAGIGPDGFVVNEDGTLDATRSFQTVNYFRRIRAERAINNVQPEVSPEPIDFIAMAVDPEMLPLSEPHRVTDAVWLYTSEERQALLLISHEGGKPVRFRYLPVRFLRQSGTGAITFERGEYIPGLPLKYVEDEQLEAPDRPSWLAHWHTEQEWLSAAHKTTYVNGPAALFEQFASTTQTCSNPAELVCRYEERRRRLVQADFVIFANNHWNFNVRNFNPGGNHASLLRPSMHSVLMFWGGPDTNIPAGKVLHTPYDALSFAPTVMRMLGKNPDQTAMDGHAIELQ